MVSEAPAVHVKSADVVVMFVAVRDDDARYEAAAVTLTV
tara:strand:+ start:1744 stop:1860 length:117 start_codon:yes stop_codon:yes gene_type:complete